MSSTSDLRSGVAESAAEAAADQVAVAVVAEVEGVEDEVMDEDDDNSRSPACPNARVRWRVSCGGVRVR